MAASAAAACTKAPSEEMREHTGSRQQKNTFPARAQSGIYKLCCNVGMHFSGTCSGTQLTKIFRKTWSSADSSSQTLLQSSAGSQTLQSSARAAAHGHSPGVAASDPEDAEY